MIIKEYQCIQVDHHKKIAEVIQEHLEKGWALHTYTTAGQKGAIIHYLLFEKG